MSILHTIARGSFCRIIQYLLSGVISFVITPYIIKTLGDKQYGLWILIATYIGYYGLLDLGLSTAVNKHIAYEIGRNNKKEISSIFNNALFIYTIIGIIVLIISCAVGAISYYVFPDITDRLSLPIVIIILGVSAAISFPARAVTGLISAYLRYDVLSMANMISLILRTILIIVLLRNGMLMMGMALATLFAQLPEILINLCYVTKKIRTRINKSYDGNISLKLISYGGYTFIAQMGDLLRVNVDSYVIAVFIGVAKITHYSIAAEMVRQFINLIIASFGVLQPMFAQFAGADDSIRLKSVFLVATKYSVIASCFVGGGLILWGEPFIVRWMGAGYIDSYPCLVILTIGWITDLWQIPSISLIYALSRQRFYAWFNISEGIINILLSIGLAKKYGILGVAIGTMVPMCVFKIFIQPVYICNVINIEKRIYYKLLMKTMLICCFAWLIPAGVSILCEVESYKALFLVGIFSISIYCIIVWQALILESEKTKIREIVASLK